VFFQKVPNRDGTSYNVDHTAASYVLDRQGQLRLFVRHTQPVEEIVADLQQLL
jgi:protein SCO1/2